MRALKSIKAAAVDRICRLDRFSPFARLRRPSKSGPQFAAGGQLFERSEENAGGVPKEKLSLPDVAREHGIRSVSGLMPDFERGDARPSRASREAGAKAMA
jgi:hypothetical protein